MNYSELLDNVRNYTEVSNQVLTNAVINVFIINIEDQVAREVDSDSQRRYATTTSVANNASWMFLDLKVVFDLQEPYKFLTPPMNALGFNKEMPHLWTNMLIKEVKLQEQAFLNFGEIGMEIL